MMNTKQKEPTADFSQPVYVDRHPGNIYSLLPKMSDIPEEFKYFDSKNKWCKAVSKWFYEGMNKSDFKVKEGIDKEMALTHLYEVISSWVLKHEHKHAGAAYLMSLWFDDVKI